MIHKISEANFCEHLVFGDPMHNNDINPTPNLNPSAQRYLTRLFTGDFASWTVHFVNKCVKNHHMHQLFFQFIMYGSSYMFRHYIAIFRERS
jgi:hypothetical protein